MNTNADGIAAAAMSSGVTAMREPNTTARTASAPAPASRVSASTLLPPPWPPEDRMLAPVTRTGAPSTRRPATARVSPGSAAVYGSLLVKSGTGYSSWNAVRPSAETKARSPVLTQDADRAPGSAAAARPDTEASWALTPGESTVMPGGSRTTTTSGGLSPPEPKPATIALLVSYPGWPGRSNATESRWPDWAAASPPARVSTSQPATTIHRWASDQRASLAMPWSAPALGPDITSFDERFTR